jgi:hypothetical protein
LLFGVPGGEKQVSFNVGTRLSLLQVLNQLQLVDDVALNEDSDAGYRLLYELLCDEPRQNNNSSSGIKSKRSAANLINRSLPSRHYTSSQNIEASTGSPKFTCWMRELATTVEKSIKPAAFLADVLNYEFVVQKPATNVNQDILQLHIEAQKNDNNTSATDATLDNTRETNDVNGQTMLEALIDNTATVYLVCQSRRSVTLNGFPVLLTNSQFSHT